MSDKFQNRYRISSARAPWWNYLANGAYFVTIVTLDRECFFGNIIEKRMDLGPIGKIALSCWQEIPIHFPFVRLDSFVIMPNHVHGIIIIDNSDIELNNKNNGDHNIEGKNQQMASISPKCGSLGAIIRSYKSSVSKNGHLINLGFNWQSRFHEHIIRTERSYQIITDYIIHNPLRWDNDKLKI